MRHFTITRQQHLIDHAHSKSVQANTILITGIPKKYLTQDALFKLFNGLPGGVKKIWVNRNLKELPDIYDRRTDATKKLESAETSLLRTAAKLRLKHIKASGKNKNANADVESSSVAGAEQVVPEDQRPTHKLGFLGLFGEKVDSIVWARNEIVECTRILDEGRAKISGFDERGSVASTDDGEVDEFEDAALDADGNPRLRKSHGELNPLAVGKQAVGAAKGAVGGVAKGAQAVKGRVIGGGAQGEYPPMNSAFVTFNKQISAHLAVQVLTHHEPYRMSNRYIEVAPEDVIWGNLGLNPYEQKVRCVVGPFPVYFTEPLKRFVLRSAMQQPPD